jgi:hypothetical protein
VIRSEEDKKKLLLKLVPVRKFIIKNNFYFIITKEIGISWLARAKSCKNDSVEKGMIRIYTWRQRRRSCHASRSSTNEKLEIVASPSKIYGISLSRLGSSD